MISIIVTKLFLLFYFVIVASTAIILMLENRQPAKTIAWLLVILLLPVAGLVIFYFFGQNIRKERYIGRKNFDLLSRSMQTAANETKPLQVPKKYQRLIMLNERRNRSTLTSGNEIQLYSLADDFLEHLLTDIRLAQHHVHLQSYIIEADEVGKMVQEALCQKAQEGIEVRLIYDDVGCWKAPKAFFERFKKFGAEVRPFLPVRFPSLTHRVNYRNHRKICVIDGEIGYIGGMNLTTRYTSRGPLPWRDLHLRVEGHAAQGLQRIFTSDWFFVSGMLLNSPSYFPVLATSSRNEASALMQMVASNPVSSYPEYLYSLTWVIQHATDYIYLQTPYFMPNESVMQALQTAAMSGVDVQLMIPEKPDAFWLRWGNNSFLTPMLKAGIRIFLYQKGVLHSKCAVADDDWCTIGSANLDFRSFENNFEANAFIYHEATAKQVKEIFLEDINDCQELTLDKWETRPWLQRYAESATRIFSPLL